MATWDQFRKLAPEARPELMAARARMERRQWELGRVSQTRCASESEQTG